MPAESDVVERAPERFEVIALTAGTDSDLYTTISDRMDEGIIAVEDAAGNDVHEIDYQFVPAVTFCHPQVASVGLTQQQTKKIVQKTFDAIVESLWGPEVEVLPGGKLRLTVSMAFAIALVAQFTIGGLSGVSHAVSPSDTLTTTASCAPSGTGGSTSSCPTPTWSPP